MKRIEKCQRSFHVFDFGDTYTIGGVMGAPERQRFEVRVLTITSIPWLLISSLMWSKSHCSAS